MFELLNFLLHSILPQDKPLLDLFLLPLEIFLQLLHHVPDILLELIQLQEGGGTLEMILHGKHIDFDLELIQLLLEPTAFLFFTSVG